MLIFTLGLSALADVVEGFAKAEQAKAVQRQVGRGLLPGQEVQIVDLHREVKLPGVFTPAELDTLSNSTTSPEVIEALSQLGLKRARQLGMEAV
jgi:hypothetical protein